MSDLEDFNLFNNQYSAFDDDLYNLYNLEDEKREAENIIFPPILESSKTNAQNNTQKNVTQNINNQTQNNIQDKNSPPKADKNSQSIIESKPKINVLTKEETKKVLDGHLKEEKIEKFIKEFKSNKYKNKQPDGVIYNEKINKFEKSPEIAVIDKEIENMMLDEKVDKKNFMAKSVNKELASKIIQNPEKSKEIIKSQVKKVNPSEAMKGLNKELVNEVLRDKGRRSKERESRSVSKSRNNDRSRDASRDRKSVSNDRSSQYKASHTHSKDNAYVHTPNRSKPLTPTQTQPRTQARTDCHIRTHNLTPSRNQNLTPTRTHSRTPTRTPNLSPTRSHMQPSQPSNPPSKLKSSLNAPSEKFKNLINNCMPPSKKYESPETEDTKSRSNLISSPINLISPERSKGSTPSSHNNIDLTQEDGYPDQIGTPSIIPPGGEESLKRQKMREDMQDFVVNMKDNLSYLMTNSQCSDLNSFPNFLPKEDYSTFSSKVMADLKSLSQDAVFAQLVKCNQYVKNKLKIGHENLFKEFITFRDKSKNEDQEVLILCLFYYIWLHENLIRGDKAVDRGIDIDKKNKKIEKIEGGKTLQNGKIDGGKIERNDKSTLNNICNPEEVIVLDYEPPKKEFLGKKRKNETSLDKPNKLNKSKESTVDHNGTGSTIVKESSKKSELERKLYKEKLEEIIQNDPKHNLIMKLAHKINDPQNLESLRALIPPENFNLIERALKSELRRNMTDFKSKMRDMLNSTLGGGINLPSNGQTPTYKYKDKIDNSPIKLGFTWKNNNSAISNKKKEKRTAFEEFKGFQLNSGVGNAFNNLTSKNKKLASNSLNVTFNYKYNSKEDSKNVLFDPLKKLDEMLESRNKIKNGKSGKGRIGTGNLFDFNNPNTKSKKNHSRDHSMLSYSTYSGITRNNNYNNFNNSTYTHTNNNYILNTEYSRDQGPITLANPNAKLRKEIETISQSILSTNVNKRTSTSFNRPPAYLNKPELEIDTKSYLDFSPTKTKKKTLVTSKLFSGTKTEGKRDIESRIFNFNLNKNSSKNILDSVDEFSKNFTKVPKKESYIERFSPKKKLKKF